MCQDCSIPEEKKIQRSWAYITIAGMILAFCVGVLIGAIL